MEASENIPQEKPSKKVRYAMVSRREQKEITRIFVWAIALEVLLLTIVVFLALMFKLFPPTGDITNVLKEHLPSIVGILFFLIIIKVLLNLGKLSIIGIVRKYSGVESSGLMLWRFLSYTVWIVVIGVILGSIVGGAWAYMVWVGVIIAAIIYALANTLQNIAAWFLIVGSQPFKIGDIVEMDGKRGYVVDVTLNTTTIREMGNWVGGDLFTGRVIQIPNRTVFEKGLANYTKHNEYIYDYLTVSITYESDLPRAEELLLQAVHEVLDMDEEDMMKVVHDVETIALMQQMPKKPKVFWQFKDSSILFGALYMVSMKKRWGIRSKITKLYMGMIKDEPNISIAYPHMELVKHEFSKDRKEVA